MKHHFADLLDREHHYWHIIPNQQRYAHSIDQVTPGDSSVSIVTISKHDQQRNILQTLPGIEEITLHEPDQQQLQQLQTVKTLKRLRISHVRVKDLSFLVSLSAVEELVLEYVSGFTDLSPLQQLPALRSLHLENLRKVSDFSGLSGLNKLQYLRIDGTLDWKQPIAAFDFLAGLPALEVLSFGQVINKSDFPALLPARALTQLKKLHIAPNMFATEEYALLAVMFPSVQGTNWGAYQRFSNGVIPLPLQDPRHQLSNEVLKQCHPEVSIFYDGKRYIADPQQEYFECTGKSAGRVKCLHPQSAVKCQQYLENYATMQQQARALLCQ